MPAGAMTFSLTLSPIRATTAAVTAAPIAATAVTTTPPIAATGVAAAVVPAARATARVVVVVAIAPIVAACHTCRTLVAIVDDMTVTGHFAELVADEPA